MSKAARHGFTTGACAAAAAQGAARMLVEQRRVEMVEVALPAGFSATFALHGQRFDATSAACYVIKDAGDDPDVTNGCEVWVEVTIAPAAGESTVTLVGGAGIGHVTKPGLAVAVGEWAINPIPRQMITDNVVGVFAAHPAAGIIRCTISIPDGEERSKRTLNARLGILGGLSILGTTGIVKPISTRAWTDTLDTAVDVALACGSSTIVLSTGRTSEVVAQRFLSLPEEAFVMMGDHVGYALRVCAAKGVKQVVLAGQFAKLLKIACGHEQTHVTASELDLKVLGAWLQQEPRTARLTPLVVGANTARHLLELAAADPALLKLVAGRVKSFAAGVVPGLAVQVLLAGYDGQVLYFSGFGGDEPA